MKAIENMEAEVIVVDNNSNDQSVEMLRTEFPSVKIIDNDFNAGFSKANNQAMDIAQGEYFLLLNPDTVVEEDCFEKCLAYMDEHAEAGGMGVKMIDGTGNFLPESKRGLPTPAVSFFKISGLSRLFPRSRTFGKYHQGFLGEDEINEIEVLSGAFMLMRKEVVDKIGGLDEAFFMYGEDIDMSFRITKAGYKNVYFPNSRIIHFKGESTKKSSVNYVLVFYRAMIIFARKHFSYKNARTVSFLINSAIYLRAFLALLNRFLVRIYMPLFDVLLLWTMLYGTKSIYENVILDTPGYFPDEVEVMAFPLLISCWIAGQLLLGGYHQPVKFKNVFKGLIAGSLFVLALYALLDESLRFSRLIVTTSLAFSFLILPLSRILLMKLGFFKLIRFTELNSVVVGKKEQIEKVSDILLGSTERKKNMYFVDPQKKSDAGSNSVEYIGSLDQLRDVIRVYDIDEVIFCLGDVSTTEMLSIMQIPDVRKCNIYLHPENESYILRSSSTHSSGEYILPETDPNMPKWAQKKKRFFEICFSILLILFSPFLMLFFRKPRRFILNSWNALTGKNWLIGFENISPDKAFVIEAFTSGQNIKKFNKKKIDYLLNYGTEKDLEILLSNFNQLDRKI